MNTYKQSGVDVAAGDQASHNAKTLSQHTFRPEVKTLQGTPVFDARFSQYKSPVLLGSTDGVGTKLKIAFEMNKHDTVGIDLVAMAVNDLIRYGAEPLTFLPYIGMQTMNPDVVQQIMKGIVKGCKQANCSILGGETAELRDIYHPGEYDLVGSAHGVVEQDRLVTGETIQEGDILLAFPSSGLHSNGYTLARKVLQGMYNLTDTPAALQGRSVGEELLTPTRIYVNEILPLLNMEITIRGIAHITGGGIPSKLGSIIPPGLQATIDTTKWEKPPVVNLIQHHGNVSNEEMYHSFNMGVGMILVVPQSEVQLIQKIHPEIMEIGDVGREDTSVNLIV